MATKTKNPEPSKLAELIGTLSHKRIRTLRLVSQITFFGVFFGVIFNLPRISFPVPVHIPAGAPYATVWGGFDALQYIIAVGQFPFLVLGMFFITGAIFGKLTCGWACPVGFWQDFLALIPLQKVRMSKPTNKELQEIAGFFMYTSLIMVSFFGVRRLRGELVGGEYWTYIPFGVIDPAGTAFVTYFYAFLWNIFDVPENQNVFEHVGTWFIIKSVILFLVTYASIKVPRFYCRYLCPTGALLGYMSKNSILTIKRDPTKCVDGCSSCEKACPTEVPILDESPSGIANSLCILCGNCVDACPEAMSFGFRF